MIWSCWRLSSSLTRSCTAGRAILTGRSPSGRFSGPVTTRGPRSSTRAGRGRSTRHDDEHGRGLAIVAGRRRGRQLGHRRRQRVPGGVVPARLGRVVSVPKYVQVAAGIRAQIADGTLLPGAARSERRGAGPRDRLLRPDLPQGAADPDQGRGAGPRPEPQRAASCSPRAPTPGERTLADAARILSASLAASRRAAGLTQAQLAEMVGVSVTTIGHAETGRLWQSPPLLGTRRQGNSAQAASSWPCTTPTSRRRSRPIPIRRRRLPMRPGRPRSQPPKTSCGGRGRRRPDP